MMRTQHQEKENFLHLTTPKDVPKGHLVVYVGEEHKRFVVRVSFLQHPLFRELLDMAEQEYGFDLDAKLCILCEEGSFDSILRCIGRQQHHERGRRLCSPCFTL